MRSSTIIVAVVAIGVCAAGVWLMAAPHASVPALTDVWRAGNVPRSSPDFENSGGQQIKPRW